MTLLDAVALPHGIPKTGDSYVTASLDQAMWFHAAFRADDWLLYDQQSPAAGGSRGYGTGRLFAVCSPESDVWPPPWSRKV